jgi:hypothetical protein
MHQVMRATLKLPAQARPGGPTRLEDVGVMTAERRKLTEPLESVTGFFGTLMVLALAVFAGFWAFGSGIYSAGPGQVCENQPGATYSGEWQTPYVSAKPGASIDIIGTVQACTNHPGIGQWALYDLTEVPTILAWCGVLLLLWRMIRVADQAGPFTPAVATAMRRLGWFILAGSLTVAVLRAVSTGLLLSGQLEAGTTQGGDLFVELVWGVIRATMPVPALAGAALLTLARIFRVGAAMDDELKGTV